MIAGPAGSRVFLLVSFCWLRLSVMDGSRLDCRTEMFQCISLSHRRRQRPALDGDHNLQGFLFVVDREVRPFPSASQVHRRHCQTLPTDSPEDPKKVKGDKEAGDEERVLNEWLTLNSNESDLKQRLRDAETDLDTYARKA